jgi:hypothetical protein
VDLLLIAHRYVRTSAQKVMHRRGTRLLRAGKNEIEPFYLASLSSKHEEKVFNAGRFGEDRWYSKDLKRRPMFAGSVDPNWSVRTRQSYGRGAGVGRDRGVGRTLGGELGVALGDAVGVGAGVIVTVGVAVGLGLDCTQYFPPLSKGMKLPPEK